MGVITGHTRTFDNGSNTNLYHGFSKPSGGFPHKMEVD